MTYIYIENNVIVCIILGLVFLTLILFSLVANNLNITERSQVISEVKTKEKNEPDYIHVALFHCERTNNSKNTIMYNPYRFEDNNLFNLYPERRQLIIPGSSTPFPRQRGISMRTDLTISPGIVSDYTLSRYNDRIGVWVPTPRIRNNVIFLHQDGREVNIIGNRMFVEKKRG